MMLRLSVPDLSTRTDLLLWILLITVIRLQLVDVFNIFGRNMTMSLVDGELLIAQLVDVVEFVYAVVPFYFGTGPFTLVSSAVVY